MRFPRFVNVLVLEASKGTMAGPDLQYYCDSAMAPVPCAQALMMLLLLELQQTAPQR
ncbi:hypothetical protein [Superficieibacter electus]|uniref:hypothetical protein n=1 Tax=Superficieibacter electus TaxID=2022662 RepID=UPI00159ECC3D|nr:hypothetical protein [Superficieibacter electus]